LEKERVVNDTFARRSLVIILDEGGLGARAYERGEHTFSAVEGTTSTLSDESGNEWEITEDALMGQKGEMLVRLPGHMAYWFGWFSFYPQTEVYGVEK
jgi:hypothetical protein